MPLDENLGSFTTFSFTLDNSPIVILNHEKTFSSPSHYCWKGGFLFLLALMPSAGEGLQPFLALLP